MHGEAEALFALFEFALRPASGVAVLDFAQRALDRQHQARPVLLEHIIDGALFQRLDGALLADGAGDEDEGCVGPPRSGDLQCVHAVETRQSVVGQNQVGREGRECFFIIGAGIHAPAEDIQASQLHFPEQHFRVLHAVFDEQYLDLPARGH
jgi:hypothetical protein